MAVVELKQKPQKNGEAAREILEFLNRKTGRNYQFKNRVDQYTSCARIIMDRLRQGYTVEECKAVIAIKCREWMHDEKMRIYLRPETLFRASKFEQYLGELESE